MDILLLGILFLLVFYTLIYLPGKYVIYLLLRPSFSFFEDLFLSSVTGLLLFTLLSYLAAFFHNSLLFVLPLLLVGIFQSLRKKVLFPKWEKKYTSLVLFFLLTSIVFSLPMLTSGKFGESIYLKGVNSFDGIWHLQLINELTAHFPPEVPGFSGVSLTGYHFFYNFLLSRFTFLFPSYHVFFQYFPLLTSFLLIIGVYTLLVRLTKKESTGVWGVFFTLFGGSFAYLFSVASLGIDQPSLALLNPPFAFSLVILVYLLFCVFHFQESKSSKWLILLTLSSGLLFMFKAYAGMIALGGVGVLSLYYLLKRNVFVFLSLFGAIFLTLITYGLFADRSSYLIFHPFWVFEKIFEENLPWYMYHEKITTYSQQGVLKGLFITYTVAALVFFFGNIGTRVIGLIGLLIQYFKEKKYPSVFSLFLFTLCCISFFLPLFFLQSGKVYEMIQLFWYFLFFLSLFTATGVSYLLSLPKNTLVRGVVSISIILLTLPSTLQTLYGYTLIPYAPYKPELVEIGQKLAKEGTYDDVVLELPSFSTTPPVEDIEKWYLGYLPTFTVFANKAGYLQFVNHEFPNTKRQERFEEIQTLVEFSLLDPTSPDFTEKKQAVNTFLEENNITFILTQGENANVEYLALPVLSNSSFTLYHRK